MTISTDDVRHVARLSRLTVGDDDLQAMTDELASILDHIGRISELDLGDIPPTSHPLAVTNVTGDDVGRPSLAPEAALANAPDAASGSFRVPQMRS